MGSTECHEYRPCIFGSSGRASKSKNIENAVQSPQLWETQQRNVTLCQITCQVASFHFNEMSRKISAHPTLACIYALVYADVFKHPPPRLA